METLPNNLVDGAELMRIAATYENQQVLDRQIKELLRHTSIAEDESVLW